MNLLELIARAIEDYVDERVEEALASAGVGNISDMTRRIEDLENDR